VDRLRHDGAMWGIVRSGLVAGLVLTLGACSGAGDSSAGGAGPGRSTTTTTSVPGAAWETVDPADVGLDPARLEDIAATAETGRSSCLVVVRDGRIAGEWYFNGTGPGTDQEVFSASKSFASTLVGIAQDDGDLSIDDPASKYIPEWRGTDSASVTIRNLVSNDSGRQWSLLLDYVDMVQSRDRTAFSVGLGQDAAPGTVWAYNNSAIQTLDEVLEQAIDGDPGDFAEDRVFEPLGMDHTEVGRDGAGNALMFMGIHSTCRDLARFGLMALHHGRWGDERIVSKAWMDDATGDSSTALNAGYGYLWWLNRRGHLASPTAASSLDGVRDGEQAEGQMVPGAPEDMFWAIGLGNQIVQVDPGTGTVVVRLGAGEARPTPPTFGVAEASRVVTEAVVGEPPSG
jgi:CubicO group peptidase (beta-lactamase class C family)